VRLVFGAGEATGHTAGRGRHDVSSMCKYDMCLKSAVGTFGLPGSLVDRKLKLREYGVQ
jgi:hypothetical protein